MKESVSTRKIPNIVDYSAEELIQLRRQRIRDRRLRKGSLICGQILSISTVDNVIEFDPVEFDAAI